MSYLKVTHYLEILLKEGRKWEFSDLLVQNSKNIDGQMTEPIAPDDSVRRHSRSKRLILILPSILICFLLKKGIDQNAIGYAIAALSIFIGLFSNLIITMYGRFLNIPKLPEDATDLQQLEDKKVKNFIRQFTFITGKNLLVATILIAVMLLILVFPSYMSIDVFSLQFISSPKQIDCDSFFLALNTFIAITLRLTVIYLAFDFFLSLLYSLGALFAFLKREYK